MAWLLYGICPVVALGMGAAAMIRRSKTRAKRQADKYTRWAVGSFGSAGIIWTVYIVGEMLQLLVILIAIGWLAKALSSKRGFSFSIPFTRPSRTKQNSPSRLSKQVRQAL